MISIFEDLFIEKKIKLDIEKYIDSYSAKYSGDRKNYSNSEDFCHYIYSEYSSIKRIEISINLTDEIESLLIEEPKEYSFDTPTSINTLFMKSCLLESLKRVINMKKNDKELIKKCKKYKINNKFNYYPDISEYNDYNNFLREISMRKEFGIHRIPKDKKNSCNKILFELAPHQLFLKNFLSNNTPYNGLLIFHGVGVGKTCSGISIAENFKNSDNKIIILAPEKIQSGWSKTIYNPLKDDNQCTRNEYNYEEDKHEKNKEKLTKKRIKEFYEMYGYLAFANSVKNYLEENMKHISEKNIIECTK